MAFAQARDYPGEHIEAHAELPPNKRQYEHYPEENRYAVGLQLRKALSDRPG